MDYFSKLPNKLFFGKDKDDKSLLKIIKDDKILLVLDYLYTNTNRKEESLFVLEDLIIECGYKLNRNKGKTNDQFKDILIKLQENKIICSDVNMDKIQLKQLVKCILNFDLSQQFVSLYNSEKITILNKDTQKIDNLKLLIYYCYLKARMYKRADGQDLYKDTEMAEVCYPSFNTIYKDLGIANDTVHKYNNILVELNLIRCKNAGKWYYRADETKSKREAPMFYTLYKTGWEEELKAGISHYKKVNSDAKVFTQSPYKDNNRNANGFIGRIEYLEKLGKATQEQIEKKNKLLEQKSILSGEKDRVFIIKELFNKYDGMFLSAIYDDKGQYNNADKEFNLELSLGLIDEDYNLFVDYEYYKWIMVNYQKDKHDYFVNCVKNRRLNKN